MNKFYDVISIGSSPKIFMKLVEYAKEGKKILIIDSSNALGGNWKVVDFSGHHNVEYGCFVIPNNKKDYAFLKNEMNINIQTTKYQPFAIYKNKRYPLNSILLYALLDYRQIKNIKNLLKIFISYFIEQKKIFFGEYIIKYFEKGIAGLLESYENIIKTYTIDVHKNQKVNEIYVNFSEKKVSVKSNDLIFNAKQILIGAGIEINKISSDKYDFFLERNRNILSLFTFVLVKIKIKKALNFSYVDLTHIENNNFNDELLKKVDFYQDTRSSYNEYKLAWRVTNLSNYATDVGKDYAILSIDTNCWFPKKNTQAQMVDTLISILKAEKLLNNLDYLIDYSWNTNEATTIGKLEAILNDYYKPYIQSTNSLFFTRNPK